MVLPCLTVALALSAVLIRNLRASLLMEMNSDYGGGPGARAAGKTYLLAARAAELAGADHQSAGGEYWLAYRRYGGD